MKYFHGQNIKHSYFEGWYFKQTNGSELFALIPGMNADEHGTKQAFIQVVTNEGAYNVKFNYSEFSVSTDRLLIKIGENEFSDRGIKVHIENEDISLIGELEYSSLFRPSHDIMGPLRFVPLMECYHGIISMNHKVNGFVILNGRKIAFNQSAGYIEKDWGTSFPEKYTWIHCNEFSGKELSVMLSIAKVPLLGKAFTGCICAIQYKGKEYRLATYSLVKILRWDRNEIVVKQGGYTLKILIKASGGKSLFAPSKGNMSRIIDENVSETASFKFTHRDIVIFDETSDNVSFEWVE